ncbi:uncharacterized protein DUF3159 [Sanguibacter antarcticus]|uniref:Uncharacterized protein DUF3159 n=1 Tax=Sanguibacter antarcticus TaxID=372484 RepID=A0A2A9E3Y3_9MICO|nr:uncharacterized protein DUF3159 [Sanguibacter antarcticus]
MESPESTEEVPATDAAPATGLRSLTEDEFSVLSSVGGVRGVVESMAPGLVFVVVFVVTRELSPALVASMSIAVLAVIARLLQRTPLTQAFGGLLGVAIGVFWAWKSGEASDYFVVGLWTNVVYLVVLLVTTVLRWPVVGLVIEGLRAGFGSPTTQEPATSEPEAETAPAPVWSTAWRRDLPLMRRYMLATWLWVGLFAVRLVVQVPLYVMHQVGWLGTARLVMGIPLWGLVLWGTWVLVRRPASPAAPAQTLPAPRR